MCRTSRFVLPLLVVLVALPAVARDPQGADAWAQSVAESYFEISSATTRDRKAIAASLPTELLEDVWILHHNTFLKRHPELTIEQRAVVLESLGLMAHGFIRVMRNGTPEERAQMISAQKSLVARATPLLGALVKDAFYDLGDGPAAPAQPRERMTVRSNSYMCYCSDNYDCGWLGGVCTWTGCVPTPSGCGYGAMFGCSGECA
jgi:hypothetical protein